MGRRVIHWAMCGLALNRHQAWRSAVQLGVVAAVLALSPRLGLAKSTPGNTSAPLNSTEWRIDCGNNGKTLDCQVINHIFQQNGAEIASIAIHPAAAAGQVFAVVQLPLGIALNAPVQLGVTTAPAVNLTLNTCIQQGCIASATLSPEFVSELTSGTKLTLSFGMANSRTVAMAVPLTGFGLAYHYVNRQ